MPFPNFFFFLLMFSIIFAVSSTSWFLVWVSLEINTISFLALIFNENNKFSSDSCFKYFFVQSISSSVLIFSSQYIFNFNMFPILMTLAIILKLGAAPFHFWFISMMQNSSWIPCLILSTLQKFIPLSLLLMSNFKFMNLFIFSSAIMGSIGGLNQTNLKSLLAFSSISHIGWMLSTLNTSSLLPLIYLSLYSFLILPIIFIFNKYSLISSKMINSLPKREQTFTFTLLLSLGGVPPLLGFFPKWMMIYHLIHTSFMIPIILILSSILNLYFYIRITYGVILMNSTSPSPNLLPSFPTPLPIALSLSLLTLPIFPFIY
uniref:NADH-ubiquinone oxidoreductase chain 2 n=1 Tax=Liphistius erawan TaxID=1155480 RepID=L7NW47_LIPER|nr:NADH dehydrogenase subunit 2 [Liphistius erawan]AFC77882.1 NADH dehydrogenase subunit 2 [Liphistius erawan]